MVVLFVREGKLVKSTAFTLEIDLPEDELLSEFLHQFYGDGRPVPEEVLLPAEAYGREALEDVEGIALRLLDRKEQARAAWKPGSQRPLEDPQSGVVHVDRGRVGRLDH